jgi:hypothetical protein
MSRTSKQRPVSGRRVDPVALVAGICTRYGDTAYLETIRREMVQHGIAKAVRERDSRRLYDWMMVCFNFQGVSNGVAAAYLEDHGNAQFDAVARQIKRGASVCPKLREFRAFKSCGYIKSRSTCNNPRALPRCPVPTHDLRKGALNQAAFSLYLFTRDEADGDFVGFIDRVLEAADRPGHPDRIAFMRKALVREFLKIYGIARKIIYMTFADFLMASDPDRPRWRETGGSMIAIDTLVHNFLHRTGIHFRYGLGHAFSSTCYGPNGCERILDELARSIDARQFNSTFPAYFPRFIQHALWRFCAESKAGICNGRNIDDRNRCVQRECPVFSCCGRVALKA